MADPDPSDDDVSSRRVSGGENVGRKSSAAGDEGDFDNEPYDGDLDSAPGVFNTEGDQWGGDADTTVSPVGQVADDKGDFEDEGIEEGEIVERVGGGDKAATGAGVTKKKEMVTTLWPELEDKFHPADVQRLVEKLVKEHLEGLPYDAEEMPRMIKVLTDMIQSKVRALKNKRYKIITHVTMGERRNQGIAAVTRCIWDPMSDCMATYTFLSETVFCCVTVYGIYFY